MPFTFANVVLLAAAAGRSVATAADRPFLQGSWLYTEKLGWNLGSRISGTLDTVEFRPPRKRMSSYFLLKWGAQIP